MFQVDFLYLKTYVWIPYLCFYCVWLINYDQNTKMAAILDAILDTKQRPFWILGTCKSWNVVIMFTVYSSYLKTYVWIPYLCFQLEWLEIFDQNRKTAAILATILDTCRSQNILTMF